MKAQQVFVRGLKVDGSVGPIDVLRLDEASFRAVVIDALVRLGALESENETRLGGAAIVYREQVGELLTLRG